MKKFFRYFILPFVCIIVSFQVQAQNQINRGQFKFDSIVKVEKYYNIQDSRLFDTQSNIFTYIKSSNDNNLMNCVNEKLLKFFSGSDEIYRNAILNSKSHTTSRIKKYIENNHYENSDQSFQTTSERISRVIYYKNNLLVYELMESNSYIGSTNYLNIDLAQCKEIKLKDIIQPNRENLFKEIVLDELAKQYCNVDSYDRLVSKGNYVPKDEISFSDEFIFNDNSVTIYLNCHCYRYDTMRGVDVITVPFSRLKPALRLQYLRLLYHPQF